MNFLKNEFRRVGIVLLPLRIFMGLAWIAVSLDKLFDPQWYNGEILRLFFQEQVQNGDVLFPFYQSLILSVFEPYAALFSGIIVFAELYCGLAILLGCFTNLALMGGIFMSLNILLAGRVNLSAFYILAQVVLLGMNSGSVLGLDSLISRKIQSRFLVAQKEGAKSGRAIHPLALVCMAGIIFSIGFLSLLYTQEIAAGGSEDPSLSIVALCLMMIGTLVIALFRALTSYVRDSPGKESEPVNPKAYASIMPMPTMTVNDFATVLVPHNVADTTVRQPASFANMQSAMINRTAIAQPYSANPPRTIQEAYSEMSTVLVPHNMSENNGRQANNRSDQSGLQKVYI